MANFGEIKAQIKRDLDRSDLSSDTDATLTDDTIAFYVKSAVGLYARQYRFWFNEDRATLTATANDRFLDSGSNGFPTDFLWDLRLILDKDNTVMLKRDAHTVETFHTGTSVDSGDPIYYSVTRNQILLYPTPTAADTLTLTYVKELTELSSNTDTNAWTADGERLIRFQAMADILLSRTHEKDGRVERLLALAKRELEGLLGRNAMQQASGKMEVPYI